MQKQKGPQPNEGPTLFEVKTLAEKISRATNRETGKSGFARKSQKARVFEIGCRSYSAFILNTLRDFPERANPENLRTALSNLADMERLLLAANPGYFGTQSEFERFHGKGTPEQK